MSKITDELRWIVNGFLEWHEGNPCPEGLFERARAAAPAGVNGSPEWDGRCVLGHCGSPSGCEDDGRCRANGNQALPTDDELRRVVAMVPIYTDDRENAYHIRLARAVLNAYGSGVSAAAQWEIRGRANGLWSEWRVASEAEARKAVAADPYNIDLRRVVYPSDVAEAPLGWRGVTAVELLSEAARYVDPNSPLGARIRAHLYGVRVPVSPSAGEPSR